MSHREEAKKLLVHYFATAFARALHPLDDDSKTEIREIVDHIVDAALEEAGEALERGWRRGAW
jgi:hypothetical protein